MDEQKIVELFQTHKGLVVKIARSYAPNYELVQDIIQQVYLEFIQKCKKKDWNQDDNLSPLLGQMTKFIAIRQWKKYQKEKSVHFQRLGEYLRRFQEKSGTANEPMANDDEVAAMKTCIEKLPPKSRQMVDLRYFLEHSTKDIAIMFSVKENSVVQSLGRIRAKLKECIVHVLRG